MNLEQWIVNRIEEDSTIMDIAVGGVWNQPLVPDPAGMTIAGVGYFYATPEAFDPDPPFRIRPAISIHRMPRMNHPTNWFGAYADMFEVWYYAPQTPDGRIAMDTVIPLVRSKFSRIYAGYEGWGGIVEPANDWVPPSPTAEFPNAISSVERFRVSAANQF